METLCAMVLMVAAGVIQTHSGDVNAQEQAPRLKIEVSTVRVIQEASEIMPIRVRLLNVSSLPLKFQLDDQFPIGLHLNWLDPEGQECRLISLAPNRRRRSGNLEISANSWHQGTVYRSHMFVKYKSNAGVVDFKLPKAGRWQVWAHYEDEGRVVKSKIVEVRVTTANDLANGNAVLPIEKWHRFALGDYNIVKAQEVTTLLDEAKAGKLLQSDLAAYLVGKYHDYNESFAAAAAAYELALQVEPRYVPRSQCLFRLAYCKSARAEYDEALELLSKVDSNDIDGTPSDAEALRQLISATKEKSRK